MCCLKRLCNQLIAVVFVQNIAIGGGEVFSHVFTDNISGQKASKTSELSSPPTSTPSTLHSKLLPPPTHSLCHQTADSLLTFAVSKSYSKNQSVFPYQQTLLHRKKGALEETIAMAVALPCILLASRHYDHVHRCWHSPAVP
jgi:hypothetical protein